MDTSQRSEAFLKAQAVLKETREKLTELSNSDLSGVHISHEWSWIPYLKEHLSFLIEQTGGVELALRDGAPPVTEEDLKRTMEKNQP
ncbi:MAG: hypothetical protein FJZ60_00095 [Chlamydiae bacterium]|nr:hypothetical protein [Chlamydiota bacterium]